MPIYEYTCQTCGITFEKQFHFNDDVDHVSCPKGHRQTRRIFSKPEIVFKGSGFYVTDNKNRSKS